MEAEKRFELVKRNTAEIIGEDELKKLLKEKRLLSHISEQLQQENHMWAILCGGLK